MRTPAQIIEERWPGWTKENGPDAPVLQLVAEAQKEALEFAAEAAEIEDDGEEIARICRAKAREII